jgi:hypothetical protein
MIEPEREVVLGRISILGLTVSALASGTMGGTDIVMTSLQGFHGQFVLLRSPK